MEWIHRYRKWYAPRSLGARGLILILIAAAAVAIPGVVAVRLYLRQTQAQTEDAQRAFLAVALNQFATQAPLSPGEAAWVAPLADESKRVCWAGIIIDNANIIEFHRRTSLPLNAIRNQVLARCKSTGTTPLTLNGKPARRYRLYTCNAPDNRGTLAAVIDLGKNTPMHFGLALAICLGLTAAGIVGALAWYQGLIQTPVEKLGQDVARLQAGIADAVLDDNTPDELQPLANAVQSLRDEMRQWRGEATYLRHSVDMRVDAKTRRVSRALSAAERDADTDSLTRLKNRRAFERDLPKLFQQQNAANRELTLILIDVDNFKNLNDTLGHQAGDELLAFLGELIRATVRRQTDLAIRFGGDEFILALPEMNALEAARAATHLAGLFQQRARTFESLTPPTALSIGVVALRQHGARSLEQMLLWADNAMYGAKRRGGGVATIDDIPPAEWNAARKSLV